MTDQQVPSADIVRAAENIDQTIDTARRNGRDDLVARLTGARHLLFSPTITVQVAGEPHQGKRTLLDALAADPLPPTLTMLPATRDFPAATTDPAPAHVLLFVSDAAQELTGSELDFLHSAAARYPETLFALTKTDTTPHWRRILDVNLAHLATAGVPVTAFPVAAALAAHHLADERVLTAAAPGVPDHGLADRATRTEVESLFADEELHARTGLPALRARLTELGDTVERTALRSAEFHLNAVTAELETTLDERFRELDAQADTAELRAEMATAQRRSRVIREKSMRWQQILNDGFASITADVDFDLKIRTRAVLAEAEKAIDAGDPARNWTAFEQWLRSRLTDETALNYAQLTASAEDLRHKVIRHLGLRENDPTVPDITAPADAAEEFPPDPSFLERSGIGRTGLSVFRSGYGGFMMFVVLTHYVLAVSIPLWFGAAAALVMGLAGLGDERRKQLDRRRTQAKSAVRTYIDQYNLRVGKDSRTTQRRIQREMRDKYATRMASVQRHADDALQAAETALDTAESAQSDRTRLTQDLTTLRHQPTH